MNRGYFFFKCLTPKKHCRTRKGIVPRWTKKSGAAGRGFSCIRELQCALYWRAGVYESLARVGIQNTKHNGSSAHARCCKFLRTRGRCRSRRYTKCSSFFFFLFFFCWPSHHRRQWRSLAQDKGVAKKKKIKKRVANDNND